ncbi:pantothenate synthetase [Nocardioides psychrotolerans]|uniref:Pantothenate synthetase n=1 Tax=Nocardioides psychrotolerans TaxID=1005945 RepID=A0A1I3MW87_9ACTN|nr:pantoate--beta-alanine ligase [Nocardioides psychrotolerans]GEP39045.1 pantothenate synthetase [Nocardioides psychrotolerans]SFJ01384.1 pantoate--beta-alanine ligase [Nocardioides psychrotolerans]
MDRPVLARTRSELTDLLAPARRQGQRVGFVPTMGALHAGHASLMRVAREHVGAGPVVVSVFVNPMQFAPGEDLARYPRTLPDDLEVCAGAGVDIVFAPTVDEVYPGGEPQVTVEPGPLASILEGRSRPTHFRGVLIVVAKLFGLVRPDVAVFGQKDFQQLTLIRRMAADLCLGVEVVGAETEREPDGLALSSRNRYLDAEQRVEALTLSRALRAAQEAATYGVGPALDAARAQLRTTETVDVDYLVVTTPELGDLPSDPPAGTEARILLAARVGTTRLIDNMRLVLGTTAHRGDLPCSAP